MKLGKLIELEQGLQEKGKSESKIIGDSFLLLVAFVARLCRFLSPATKVVARD